MAHREFNLVPFFIISLLSLCFNNILTEPFQKRRAQNRAAQRAYRERREQRVKELEAELQIIEAKYTDLFQIYSQQTEELEILNLQIEMLGFVINHFRRSTRVSSTVGPPHAFDMYDTTTMLERVLPQAVFQSAIIYNQRSPFEHIHPCHSVKCTEDSWLNRIPINTICRVGIVYVSFRELNTSEDAICGLSVRSTGIQSTRRTIRPWRQFRGEAFVTLQCLYDKYNIRTKEGLDRPFYDEILSALHYISYSLSISCYEGLEYHAEA